MDDQLHLHTIASWCVFTRAVGTNNDVEGWHRRLNTNAKKEHLSFYQLITLLHQECKKTDLEVQLVSDGKLTIFHGIYFNLSVIIGTTIIVTEPL